MKKGDVQLFTSKLNKNNHQHTSVYNEQLEQLQTQEFLNTSLTKQVNALHQSSLGMINSIKNQEAEFERRGKIEKQHRLYLKQVINHMAYTIEQFELQLRQQNKLIKKLTENVNEQNEQDNIRKLEHKVDKQRGVLRNLSRKQSYFFDEIIRKMDKETKVNKEAIMHQKELSQQYTRLEDNMKQQFSKQTIHIDELKTYLLQLLQAHKNIQKVLALLPPNYPIKQVIVNGEKIRVTHFLFFNEATGIAYFALENETISIIVHKIEAIYWA